MLAKENHETEKRLKYVVKYANIRQLTKSEPGLKLTQ